MSEIQINESPKPLAKVKKLIFECPVCHVDREIILERDEFFEMISGRKWNVEGSTTLECGHSVDIVIRGIIAISEK